jgi:uncharacterized membrane protein
MSESSLEKPVKRAEKSSTVGFFMASNSVPRSFQKTLMERDSVDQGIVTGLTMALNYAIGTVLQDILDNSANKLAENEFKNNPKKQKSVDKYSLLMSALATGGGLLLQNSFKQKNDEKLTRAGTRTLGYWLTQVGTAGILAFTLEKSARAVTKKETGVPNKPYTLLNSLIVPIGAVISIATDHFKYREQQIKDTGNEAVKPLKSAGIGLGVAISLGLIAYGEKKAAHAINKSVTRVVPGLKNSFLPIGHLVSLGILGAGVTYGIKHLYKKIENGESKIEASFFDPPKTSFVSGGFGSAVDWDTLSLQGRRHIGTRLTKNQIAEVLELPISKTHEPIRVYVGLDSADTEDERVELALKELVRTKAYDKKLLVIISPTGTGYVNYVMSDSVEYMSKGDCAMVTIQYSKRPSPLSLDRVDEGYIQYRKLINGIRKELQNRPANKRPKIVLFGESLGAWTSQDAFSNEGTDGFEANGINKALWIGTPAESKWKKSVLSGKSLNVQPETVGVFNDFSELLILPKEKSEKLKYIMITHDDDPVARFSASLLIQAPEWLLRDAERPKSIPKSAHYRTPTTFVQTLVDMKNALKPIPGNFVADGHDYRGDLADFIRFTYDMDINDSQYIKINKALRQNDINRSELMD